MFGIQPRGFKSLTALYVACAMATPAHADLGVPMLAVMWPVSWLMLIPIVFLEGWMAMRELGVRRGEGFRLATTANLYSTLLGIPVAWFVSLAIGWPVAAAFGDRPASVFTLAVQVVCASPWIFPDDPVKGWQTWMVISAAMFLCVPFFLISVAIEGSIVRNSVSRDRLHRVWRWAWRANLLSYGLIELGLAVMVGLARTH